MSDHPNAELVRRAYEAVATGDGGPMTDMLADGVKWHLPGRSKVAGDFDGKDAVIQHWHDLSAASGESISVDVAAVLADDRFAVAIEHVQMERDGKRYDRHDLVVFRIKDGKVAEGWSYPENLYEWDDVLS